MQGQSLYTADGPNLGPEMTDPYWVVLCRATHGSVGSQNQPIDDVNVTRLGIILVSPRPLPRGTSQPSSPLAHTTPICSACVCSLYVLHRAALGGRFATRASGMPALCTRLCGAAAVYAIMVPTSNCSKTTDHPSPAVPCLRQHRVSAAHTVDAVVRTSVA